jgi:hypothetical protein
LTDHAALKKSLLRLRRLGAIPAGAPILERRMAAAGRALRQTVVDEVPALAAGGNDVQAERDRHAMAHLREICRLMAGGEPGDFEFVREHARVRAEQHFPLEASLHAYRCGHQVLSRWMRAAALAVSRRNQSQSISAVADFSIEYTNAISATMTAAYVEHTRQLAEAEGDRRTDLLNALLSGQDVVDGRVAQLLRRAGYLEPRQSFCVALVQSVDPLEMQSAPRVQRIIDSVTEAVRPAKARTLIGIRNDVVTAVFAAAQRQSGWTAASAKLAERLRPALLTLGPAVLVGLSRDQPSIALIPKALLEASVALDNASVVDRVLQFGDLPLRRLLLHGGREYVRNALPGWAEAFGEADLKAHGALSQTLRAYADADMNLIRAARLLELHPNTLYARMQRIKAVSGLNCQRYHSLTDLLLVVECSAAGR